MSRLARIAGLLAVAALLLLGAAGYSGYVPLPNDPCIAMSEGTSSRIETRWTPPGIECVYREEPGSDDGTLFNYEGDGYLPDEPSGSWPAFLGVLAFGVAVVALGLRRWPTIPAWLRLTTGTTLTFAVGGAMAIAGGVQPLIVGLLWLGLPISITIDWLLRGRDRPWSYGFGGAAVALPSAAFATLAYLFGFGLAAYGATILLVAAVTALPWRRLPPRLIPSP
jgi:hypothetical protein